MLKKILILILSVISLLACNKESAPDCLKTSGEIISEERMLLPFNKIEAYNRFNIIITQDSAKPEYAVLTGGKNLLPEVKLDVRDSTLYITNENSCNWVRNMENRITIALNIHNINKLDAHDDVYINSGNTISAERLFISHAGMGDIFLDVNIGNFLQTDQYSSGEITLNGYAAVFVASIQDVGGMYASGMQGDYTFVFHYGTNECHVKPLKQLGVTIYYTGNIYYYAEPKELEAKVINASGKLIRNF